MWILYCFAHSVSLITDCTSISAYYMIQAHFGEPLCTSVPNTSTWPKNVRFARQAMFWTPPTIYVQNLNSASKTFLRASGVSLGYIIWADFNANKVSPKRTSAASVNQYPIVWFTVTLKHSTSLYAKNAWSPTPSCTSLTTETAT